MRPGLSHQGEQLRKGAAQAGGLVAAKAADLKPQRDTEAEVPSAG